MRYRYVPRQASRRAKNRACTRLRQFLGAGEQGWRLAGRRINAATRRAADVVGLLDPFVTVLEAHNLMYFMQAAGEPLKLRFTKGPYGPYAENLRHVLHAIEGNLLSGYADGGDAPDRRLQLVPGALEEARAFLKDKADTHARFARVSELVDGFESPFGLELLATVHWVAVDKAGALDLEEVTEQTYAWNDRKKQFSRRQIELALGVLSEKGWLHESQ